MNEIHSRSRLLSKGVLFLVFTVLILILFTPTAIAAAQIYGTVTDAETGRPIEGAEVYVYDPGSKETKQKDGVYQTKTDGRGYYELDCDPGDYNIYVSKDGYEAYNEAVTLDGDMKRDIELTPGSGGTKDDPSKDDPKKDDPDKDGDSSEENENLLLLSVAIVGVLIVIVVLLAMLWPKKKETTKKDKIKNDDWTTCPECGTDLKIKDLAVHNETVHSKSSKNNKKKMAKKKGNRKMRMKNRGGVNE
jgi:hypothetical protein